MTVNEYIKDFDGWGVKKKEINASVAPVYVHEREVWFCSLGVNVGSEQDGKHELFERPVLVLRCVTKNTFIGVPMTSNKKKGTWFVEVPSLQSSAIISQLKLIDTKRLNRKISTLIEVEFAVVRAAVKEFL